MINEFLSIEIRNDLIKIIQIVISELEWELSIRTGYYENEYKALIKKLSFNNSEIFFSGDEFSMMHQALNEFYNGFDNYKWEDEVLMNKTAGEGLMNKIKVLIK